jgi:hypothetical protein
MEISSVMEIRLSEQKLNYCRALANRRNSNKEENNIPSHKIDEKQTEEGAHYLGLRGEAVIISEIWGQSLDNRILLRGDGGILDFTTPNGHTIQCKTRKDFKDRDDIYLFFNHLSFKSQGERGGVCSCHGKWVRNAEVFLADYAYLVVSDDNDEGLMTVLGSIKRENFLKKHIVKSFSYGPRYAISHKELAPVPEDYLQRLQKYNLQSKKLLQQ